MAPYCIFWQSMLEKGEMTKESSGILAGEVEILV